MPPGTCPLPNPPPLRKGGSNLLAASDEAPFEVSGMLLWTVAPSPLLPPLRSGGGLGRGPDFGEGANL